ncbi:SGNH/GDSL hydrolase family protein [Allomuricauda sp. CP2A]|uniref:SGNH/GDSL hydrolase family protein n=1 Tax=Allomuricauda sp. CP2A TaxID=1848189 RepID=UPI000832BF1C|nr:GDSL-type esterase/lipase family protein [Muricauda sp. CP2A]
MKKKTIFKIIAVGLPLFLILLLELILRLFGYGDNYHLFNKVIGENGVEYLVVNSNLSKKYFKDTDFKADNQSDLFLRHKTDSTFRVFVQGASTVVGYPFYRGASFPRLLKHRLSRTFPEMNIEVVNTGITAVNSYTLWDVTDKIIDQKPDLVIIYAGHNEYYGALGVGSSASVGSHPALVRSYLKLKNLRFFQLLENGIMGLMKSDPTNKKSVAETTLMEVMAKEQEIPLNSEAFNAGVSQFEGNLKRILDKYKRQGIPVILSTLVSNEKDVKPFISDDLDKVNYVESIEKNKPEVRELAQKNADGAYTLGHYYLEKEPDSAKKYLHLAKELDLLRFRAPEQINDVITELAQDHNLPLVDMKNIFESKVPNGILGDELVAEHVHPNVEGYFVMADAFYEKIKDLKLLEDWDNYISYEEAFDDIPMTQIDSIKGKLVVDILKKSWPYDLGMSGKKPDSHTYVTQNPTYEEEKAISLYTHQEPWQYVMTQAYNKYKEDGDYKNALKVAQTLIFEFPEQYKVYEMAGEMCRKLQDEAYADYYFAKSRYLKNMKASPE